MFHRIHQKLGTAGFIISIVALVAALGGGAYAASGGLNGKQKKEVEKIAKKFAGKPGVAGAQGAKGDGGAAGTNGSDGANGEKGERGPQGERGAPGEIANVVPLAKSNGEGHCELGGGVKIYNETGEGFACNGEAGSGGGGGEEGYPDTLPAGKTETGYFEFLGKSGVGIGTFVVSTLSFPLRLATAPELVYYRANAHSEEEEEKCPGTGEMPAAEPGVLCLYPQLTTPESFLSQTATPIGASFIQENTEEHPAEAGFGSWAVTAPEAP